MGLVLTSAPGIHAGAADLDPISRGRFHALAQRAIPTAPVGLKRGSTLARGVVSNRQKAQAGVVQANSFRSLKPGEQNKEKLWAVGMLGKESGDSVESQIDGMMLHGGVVHQVAFDGSVRLEAEEDQDDQRAEKEYEARRNMNQYELMKARQVDRENQIFTLQNLA